MESKETKLTDPIIVRFKDWLCKVDLTRRYANGRTAIQFFDTEDGEPILTATVNMVNEDLGPDEVFIKDYSENEGILKVLTNAGIVKAIGTVSSGYVTVDKCKLLIPIP